MEENAALAGEDSAEIARRNHLIAHLRRKRGRIRDSRTNYLGNIVETVRNGYCREREMSNFLID